VRRFDRRSFLRAASWGATSAWAGCGLSDLANTSSLAFPLPTSSFAIDPASEGLGDVPVGVVPAVSCSPENATQSCCGSGGIPFSCDDLEVTCTDGVCGLDLSSVNKQSISLSEAVDGAGRWADGVIQEVTVREISYAFVNNLNVPLPAIDVYVAPEGVESIEVNDGARFVVRLPAQPAGLSGSETVTVGSAGRSAFASLATNYRTTFSVLAHARLELRPNDLVPQGRAEVTLGGTGLVGW